MLSKEQLSKIKESLLNTQNPIFFFDNDPDGLCSFLILQRYIKKGIGIPIRSFPEMNSEYFKKVMEFKADSIFILDKPLVSKSFFEEVERNNLPLTWIDHHNMDNLFIPEFVNYFNPCLNLEKSNEPTTYLCYKSVEKKEDLWLAIIGCISDRFTPEFYEDFKKEYPDLSINSKDPFDIFYNSQIGLISKIFSYGLKDSITNVNKMLKFLISNKSPYEILEETPKNIEMHIKYKQISKRINKLVEKAISNIKNDKIFFFQYGGDLSISSDLANELNYLFPKKIIVVIYFSGIKANISARGVKIREPFLKALKEIPNSTGGGHENAVGAQMRIEDIEKFKQILIKNINLS
jgi:oligoribonuclease NrnB/cAMP/cGMP phosphodiesterase (DHH superfamily)